MKPHTAVNLFGVLLIGSVWAFLSSCSLYVSIEGKKKPVAVEVVKPEVKKEKPKTKYEAIKEAHNTEWLNLPHRESENELFQPK